MGQGGMDSAGSKGQCGDGDGPGPGAETHGHGRKEMQEPLFAKMVGTRKGEHEVVVFPPRRDHYGVAVTSRESP